MKTPIEYFQEGYLIAQAGIGAKACPLLFDAWPRQAWLAGHAFQLEYRQANYHGDVKPLRRVEATPFVQGQVAYSREIGFEDCPYEGADKKSWELGWLSQSPNCRPAPPEVWFIIGLVVSSSLWAIYLLVTHWQ